jgi:hypothetical protein
MATGRTKVRCVTPEYRAWCAVVSSGKACRRWRSYPHFRRDVGPRPSWAHLLMRDDAARELGPTTAGWRIGPAYRARRRTARPQISYISRNSI